MTTQDFELTGEQRKRVAVPGLWSRRTVLLLALLFCSAWGAARSQGVLTVTPGRTVATAVAGLDDPQGMAYDSQGNLYVADAQNHVVREMSASGTVTVVAGTGVEGYSGDGGAATTAALDTPTGVAVDAQGNLYIADSHNHCIREVIAGIIKTIAGTGKPGFSGDGGAATAAQLWLPRAVAVDANGVVYIADTGNQRIRTVTGTTITTIAGDGEELFAGDGGTPASAVFDSPAGIAVDTAGNLYIADRHNQRIRKIGGNAISTIAGSGATNFAGGFAGDGGAATSALLSRPEGVSVDGSGNLYIADTGNQRIRELGGGSIVTIAGSGAQGAGADGNTPGSVNLNAPHAVAPDASGNLAISDALNNSVRVATLPSLSYASDGVGVLSPSQTVTLSNSGSAPIVVSAMNLSGPFSVAAGGSCSSLPISLASNASCTENLSFVPTVMGAASGSVAFSGTGIVPQTVLLSGSAVRSATTLTLTANTATALVGEPITVSAVAHPAGSGIPTGTVTFYNGATQIGATQNLVNGVAVLTTTMTTAGVQEISAVYSGAATTFLGSNAGAIAEDWLDFTLSPASSGGTTMAVNPGAAAAFNFTVSPMGGTCVFPVTLSATGLPPGAVATFTPNSIAAGAMPGSFTMTVQTAISTAKLGGSGSGLRRGAVLALLLLPFTLAGSRKGRRAFSPSLCAVLLLGLMALGSLSGCSISYSREVPQAYIINVTATASDASGTVLTHSTPVTLTVQ